VTFRLQGLLDLGQSPWLDYIRRSLLTSGELERLVQVDGINGVTSNPTIFEKAVVGSHDYDAEIQRLLREEPDLPVETVYERLVVEDVTRAADVLRAVYDRTGGRDGFVSLEVSPGVSHDTGRTIEEARRLWKEVDRPNLLIKVPATPEGVQAVEALLSEGINVNITLMFSRAHYEAVAQAYLRAGARTPRPERLASVASIFVSRIDTAVDRELAQRGPEGQALLGRIAVANARLIYRRFQELFQGPAFARLAARGVRPQRVLWASTSTKDPRYRDTLYVEELAGPETINTLPPSTLQAFEDHGRLKGPALAEGLAQAQADLAALQRLGVDLDRITDALQQEGIQAFARSFDHLLASLKAKQQALRKGPEDPVEPHLGPATAVVERRLAQWEGEKVGARFWRQDPSLWPQADPKDVATRMGWLTLPEVMVERLPEIDRFVQQVRADDLDQVVLLGMGGSSLAPDVFSRVLPAGPGSLRLRVLDSTHPDAVAAVRRSIDLRRSLFLVSSKSGTTTEPLSFYHYFREELARAGEVPGRHFAAITDPGTPLEKLAVTEGFRAVFRAVPTVGGRYSALTHFGLVPAALLGADLGVLLNQAWTMAEACAASVPAAQSPGLALGATLGELATTFHRDKLTLYAEGPLLAPFPVWVEQLVAESTGKSGRGIVPVVDEPFAPAARYGADRLFVVLVPASGPGPELAAHLEALSRAGHPYLMVKVPGPENLGEEFFRWEFAVAASGMLLGIDPFDQPDVELAKELAREAMAHPGGSGGSPAPDRLSVNAGPALGQALKDFLGKTRPGDYVCLQAYLAPSPETWSSLQGIRRALLVELGVATTLGYGPRFLHSTGQLHKGGPNTGLFLQLVDTPREEVPVPGAGYGFGTLLRAQADGDLAALRKKGRRVLRVDLGADLPSGLRTLSEALHG
jgi:transaldolase/glucose-6-phosphate isomerase